MFHALCFARGNVLRGRLLSRLHATGVAYSEGIGRVAVFLLCLLVLTLCGCSGIDTLTVHNERLEKVHLAVRGLRFDRYNTIIASVAPGETKEFSLRYQGEPYEVSVYANGKTERFYTEEHADNIHLTLGEQGIFITPSVASHALPTLGHLLNGALGAWGLATWWKWLQSRKRKEASP